MPITWRFFGMFLKDGQLIAAAEEERFRRVKHWAGFPSEAIQWCLREAKASLSDLDHVAINSDPKAQFLQKLSFTVKRRPDLQLILDRVRNRRERQGIDQELEKISPKSHLVEKFIEWNTISLTWLLPIGLLLYRVCCYFSRWVWRLLQWCLGSWQNFATNIGWQNSVPAFSRSLLPSSYSIPWFPQLR